MVPRVSRRFSLTSGAERHRSDDSMLSLRVVEHPGHVKRMQKHNAMHMYILKTLVNENSVCFLHWSKPVYFLKLDINKANYEVS